MNHLSSRILVVDDDAAVAEVLASLLEQANYSVTVARCGTEALSLLRDGAFDAVLSDIRMPPPDGMALLQRVQSEWSDVPFLLLTAFATVPLAVQAMKWGAADFIMKPFDRVEVLNALSNALRQRALLRERPPEFPDLGLGIVGECGAMREVVQKAAQAAQSNATVLVRGETGTGKRLVARAIHSASPRAQGPFVTLSLSNVPDSLVEDALGGYGRIPAGAAIARAPGQVQLAQGGTLFFDEIGDASLPAQASVLGVLKAAEEVRTAHGVPEQRDTQFVAATHRDLESMIRVGQWRQDLYYMLNVVSLELPPLRERGTDAVLIARAICSRLATTYGREIALDDDVGPALITHSWPGNVRELANLIERLAVFSPDGTIRRAVLEQALEGGLEPTRSLPFADRRRQLDEEELMDVLRRSNGNRSQAARLLGVSRRTLYSKLKSMGIPSIAPARSQ